MDSENLRIMRHNNPWCTVQGEGLHVGTPSVFLRLAGCNLRCEWCDTPASLPDFNRKLNVFEPLTGNAIELPVGDVRELVAFTQQLSDYKHLVITGGEPMLQQEALEGLLYDNGQSRLDFSVTTVETNCEIEPASGACYFGSLSPKVERYFDEGNYKTIQRAYIRWARRGRGNRHQLKVVASSVRTFRQGVVMIRELRKEGNHEPHWTAIQIENAWLRDGWGGEQRGEFIALAAQYDIRVVAQMHPVLKVP